MTTLEDLRRFAVARTFFAPTDLQRAIERCGFIQADPIRAPARAQDLTLRHRVRSYRAGDLERRYARLDVEEDVFVNYGFVPRTVHALMQPRESIADWPAARRQRARVLLEFVRQRGSVHPRQVDEHFSHGTVVNYWGRLSNATTRLLEDLHYAGALRVVRREAGIRIYAVSPPSPAPAGGDADARLDSLVDVAARAYSPLPAPCLATLVGRLRYGVPQWRSGLRAALQRARARLAHAHVGSIDWFWPATERRASRDAQEIVRLLSPFDPLVWDRRRFEMLWGWPYRFEAYTPVARRRLGYYALPLLWKDRVIGWANLAVRDGRLLFEVGFVAGRRPRDGAFARALDEEIDRMRAFLGLEAAAD